MPNLGQRHEALRSDPDVDPVKPPEPVADESPSSSPNQVDRERLAAAREAALRRMQQEEG